jgi:integrase
MGARLTTKFIAKSDLKPGLYGDGDGLALQVSQQGTKAWVLRYMLKGKARKMGLGAVSAVTLAEARSAAADARKLLAAGVDPIGERDDRRAAQAVSETESVTFGEVAKLYIESQRPAWKSRAHDEQWTMTILGVARSGRPAEVDYCKIIRDVPVAAVDTGLVMRVLEPIWHSKPETASRVRGRIEAVIDYAKARGWRTGENPARWRGHIALMLPKKTRIAAVEHHAAMPYAELPSFMARLRDLPGVRARALEFCILTAVRRGDVLGATWAEIDPTAKTWTIPAERVKGKRGTRKTPHVVPLSDRALEILASLPRVDKFVFPGPREGHGLYALSLAIVLKTLAPSATVHGFRSSFRDWAAEQTGYPSELAELSLAHAVGSAVERAYRRGDQLAKRVRLMQDWAHYCEHGATVGANVVSMRG